MNEPEELAVSTLEDVLSNDEEVVESAEEVKVEETETESTDDKEPESTSDSDETKGQTVPLAALLDERDKRQKRDKEIEERDARIAELTNVPEEKRPDVFEDQDAAFQHQEQSQDSKRLNDKFELSRDFMSMLKDDYEDREKQFMELAKETPSLRQELLTHPNPARFAYETAVKHSELKEMANIDEFKDKMRAELREEILAEIKAESESNEAKEAAKREAITPSLATRRSTSGFTSDSKDLETVDDIL